MLAVDPRPQARGKRATPFDADVIEPRRGAAVDSSVTVRGPRSRISLNTVSTRARRFLRNVFSPL